MPDFTYPSATVLIERTGELAVGAAGVLRSTVDGDELPIYDLDGSPITHIRVRARGVHQPFKADVPDGLLDFGAATLFPVVSSESHRSGMQAIQIAEAATDVAAEAVTAAEQATSAAQVAAEAAQQAAAVVVATPRFVLHGDDPDVARPEENVLPVIWVGTVQPNHAVTGSDTWVRSETWA